MGSWWDADEINRFVEALPETTMFILDEAYCELAPASALPAIDVSRPNVVRMRTFSKAYGLAGIRCGYAIGEKTVTAAFEKIRNHYGVSRMAQIAGEAAIKDQTWLTEVVRKVEAGRQRIAAIAAENGLDALPSATNFVAVDCGIDGAFALKVLQNLLARGVFIRKPMVAGLDRCVRISVGLDHELDILAEELPKALAAARAG
jgi:histidinol-phosphate aminotransferase